MAGDASHYSSPDDEYYMRQALALTSTDPFILFTAVIVDRRTGQIVAQGVNHSEDNPIWHGEIDAIHHCGAGHPGIDWSHLTLYTTGEPCSMCQSAICWAGIRRVVYASSIPFFQGLGWDMIDIRAEEVTRRTPWTPCEVVGGVLREECDALFQAWADHDTQQGADR
jgi:tRNA(Arg) A34 adenosine deaminase TadA